MSTRQVINLEVDSESKERFETMCKDMGMVQRTAASRLFDWFVSQPQTVRMAILGQIPEDIAPDVARLILERMAGSGSAPDQINEAIDRGREARRRRDQQQKGAG